MTQNYFDKIRRAPTYDEALTTGQELLKALTSESVTFDDATEQIGKLIGQTNGIEDELLGKLLSLRQEYSSVSSTKAALLQSHAAKLAAIPADVPDAAVDSLVCDFYAEATPLVAKENSLRTELNELMLSAQQSLLGLLHERDVEALQKNQKAEIGAITDLAAEIAAKATVKAASMLKEASPHQTSPTPESEPLTAIVEAYCANQISEGSWTEKTKAENEAIYALWIRIVGDRPIRAYGFEQHREYKLKLQQLPPNLNKSPRYRGKSIADVIALGDKAAAPNTINKNLTRVSALFEWAIKYGYATENPARGMVISNPKRASEERQAFTDDDLRKLFGSTQYLQNGHKHPYQYWVPLIALYTGARLNEICQLHLCDLDVIDGINVIRISEEGGNKRLKTKAARRIIPIHSELLRLGLTNYANTLREQVQERLFPELKLGRDGYGKAASKWFATYSTQCGVDAPGKVFHSFRHTFIDRLKQADVPKEKISALVGHEDESVTFGRYGKDYSPITLKTNIELLKFPTDPIVTWNK